VKALLALAVGYAVGTRAREGQLDELAKALKALSKAEEFADLLKVGRSQLAKALRDLAEAVEGSQARLRGAEGGEEDLVAKVRRLVERG
jgi:hypothetical protein